MKNQKLIMGMVIGAAATFGVMYLMNRRNEGKSEFRGGRMRRMARPMGGAIATAKDKLCSKDGTISESTWKEKCAEGEIDITPKNMN